METLFLDVLNATICVSWLIIAVLFLRFCLQKAPKYVRCLLWGIVALQLLLPVSFESVWSVLPTSKTIPDEILYASTPAIDSGIPAINEVVNPILQNSLAPQSGNSVNPIQLWLFIGGYLWLFGVGIFFLYAVFSYWSVRRHVRVSVPLYGNIRLCDNIPTPFILGVFCPHIYVPSDMEMADRDYVIAHERAHLARYDHLWKPLGFVLLSLHWFNPLMWVAYIALCRDIELACDEKVLTAYGTDHKKAYADVLIRCSSSHKRITACPLAFGETAVKGRIRSILQYKKPAFWLVVTAAIACIAVAVGFLTVPKDKWQSTNYGIVGSTSGTNCENVQFFYHLGSVNGEAPHITATWKNNTDTQLRFGKEYTLYYNDKPCPTVEPPRFIEIMMELSAGGELQESYDLSFFDLSQSGSYRLETAFYLSGSDKKYTAYINFTIDRMYSFAGWQYSMSQPVYGKESPLQRVYITEDSLKLLLEGEKETWRECGELQQTRLSRSDFDVLFTDNLWQSGYSAERLRKNNKHAVSIVSAARDERYVLLEQKNGEIYLCIGSLSYIDQVWLLSPLSQSGQLNKQFSPINPTPKPIVMKEELVVEHPDITFSPNVYCREENGRLLLIVRWVNGSNKSLCFGPQYDIWENKNHIFVSSEQTWDTFLYHLEPHETREEIIDITCCKETGTYRLEKQFQFVEEEAVYLVTYVFTRHDIYEVCAQPITEPTTSK